MRIPILRGTQTHHGGATSGQWMHMHRSKTYMTLVLMAFMLVCFSVMLICRLADRPAAKQSVHIPSKQEAMSLYELYSKRDKARIEVAK